jgi:hypothetical protein
LILTLPVPFVTVARAIAVLCFPDELITLTMRTHPSEF